MVYDRSLSRTDVTCRYSDAVEEAVGSGERRTLSRVG